MAEDLVVVTIKSGKKVKVPRELFENGHKLSARAYAVETGQATWAEVNGEEEYRATAENPVEAAMIAAGREVSNIGSNLRQFGADLFGNDRVSEAEKAKQRESARLTSTVREDFPVASFAGSTLPYFAVPGGKAAQLAAGAVQGALEGDTVQGRLGGAALGLGLGFVGQKAGDKLGAKLQNRIQKLRGNPNAAARSAMIDAGVPMTLSQRTDGPLSKPLARFFERGRFVLTGSAPKAQAQQARLTELITEALGVKGKKLTREVLGEAVDRNKDVFRQAAQRVGGPIKADGTFVADANRAVMAFTDVGTDSPQVARIFEGFEDFATDLRGIEPAKFLKLRSKLSEATTKSDIETEALVDAIKAMDDQLARLVPDLADDLMTARDRFRLLLAIRRGAALSPQGDINVQTLTRNLERVFKNFDANKPLPRGLRDAGEAIAGYNQIVDPFRSSGTAENALAGAVPGGFANADPSLVLRTLMGASAPFAGGGTGGLLGGGLSRALLLNGQQ